MKVTRLTDEQVADIRKIYPVTSTPFTDDEIRELFIHSIELGDIQTEEEDEETFTVDSEEDKAIVVAGAVIATFIAVGALGFLGVVIWAIVVVVNHFV